MVTLWNFTNYLSFVHTSDVFYSSLPTHTHSKIICILCTHKQFLHDRPLEGFSSPAQALWSGGTSPTHVPQLLDTK